MATESRTAVMAALAGNVALAGFKGVAAAATGSAAMLAETLHSVADTGNQVLLLLGMRLSRRRPDRWHPFGYGRAVYFWGFVVSVMLFTLGGAFSIWEGVEKWRYPTEQRSMAWAYGVLAGGFLFESGSLLISLRAVRREQGHRSLRQYWRDNRDSTLPTVVLEDTAALVSLGFAAVGIWLAHWTGNPVWDAGASVAIGVVLIAVAAVLAAENYSLLLGESAPREVVAAIERAVREDRAVRRLVDLRTIHIGPRRVVVTAGVRFARKLTVADIETAVRRLEDAITGVLGDRTDRALITIEPTQGEDHEDDAARRRPAREDLRAHLRQGR
jgi:cation diffusion facilitator family transporter